MSALVVLTQIVLIDLAMAADNALVVGFLVAGLPHQQRKRATMVGIAAATVLRVVLAFFAVQLLHISGLILAGGILLVWVAWKMVREYHHLHHSHRPAAETQAKAAPKNMTQAVLQIVVADFSMSLDNVLGVAGVARDHKELLVIGLVLSAALMGFVATQVARLTARYPKIALIGTAVVLCAALSMIYDGSRQIGLINHALV